jgi:type I restriction enzyme S subunit
MSEWLQKKLGEVSLFQRGHDLPKTKMIDGIYPVAGSNSIIGFHNAYTTEGPSITIGRSGNIGTPYYFQSKFWAHNTVLYVKDFFKNHPKFIYYLLKTIDFSQYNAGSAVPTLNRNHIHEHEVSIPPLPEQQAIAEVLSSLDDKIDLLHRNNKTLEEMAETLFRQWFVEGAKDDWDEKALSDLGKIICGKTPSTSNKKYFNGNIPFVKIPDMHGNVFILNTTTTLSEEGKISQAKKTLPPGSIMVSCIATVGLVAISTKECQTNQQINSIIPRYPYLRNYLFLQLCNLKEELKTLAGGGSVTENLNTTDFSNIAIKLPSTDILLSFDDYVSPLFEKLYQNMYSINKLQEIRDSILPKLMSGQVRVQA